MYTERLNSLKGKTALIMGAGKARVGKTVALTLAELKMNIALHYRSSEADALLAVDELRKMGVRAEAFQADIANEEDIRKLVDNVISAFGSIYALINTAADYHRTELEKLAGKDLDYFYQVNLRGNALVASLVGQAMRKQKQGVIVNIGDWAITRPYNGYFPYIISKGAIPTMSLALANELAPYVRVNYIMPGPVLLPSSMLANEKAEAISKTLLKKDGTPENIALAVVHYLINDFITGDGCFVDGGKHANGS